MATEIKISDPNDKPFGCLSNNYMQKKLDNNDVKINRINCMTLTNYIYANFLKQGTHKSAVCREKDYTIVKKKFTEFNNLEIVTELKKSIMTALDIMFKNSPELTKLLLSTGNSDIKYVSTFLGNNSTCYDKNLYGICLQQQRHKIKGEIIKKEKQSQEEKEEQSNYDIYIVYKGLTTLIKDGIDITGFSGKKIEDIIQQLGREVLEKPMNKNNFLIEYSKGSNFTKLGDLYKYPQNLVPYILKTELPILFTNNQRKKKKEIFSMYADYLLEKEFKDVEEDNYEVAKNQEFNNQTFKNMANQLEDRLYALYKAGSLSERLSNKMDKIDKSYPFPSQKQVEEAEKYTFSYDKTEKKDLEEQHKPEIFVYPYPSRDSKYSENAQYTPLSPLSFFEKEKVLKIDNRVYISIIHYIIVNLLIHIGISHDIAYTYILKNKDNKGAYTKESFVDPIQVISIYNNQKQKIYADNLIKYTKKGLELKFNNNRVLQDFLLATGNATLIYDSNVGDANDNSIFKRVVGQYLMELREKFSKQRPDDKFNLLKADDVTWLFKNDSFMNEWVKKRVFDSCTTLIIMKDYLKYKYNQDIRISGEFTRMVLDNIYQPCSEVYGAADEIKAEAPEYFSKMVAESPISTRDSKVIDVIWKRLAVVIYYLIVHLKTNLKKNIKNQDISSEIVNIQTLTNNIYQCEEIITGDDYANCIASAIINLICGIYKFNKKISKDPEAIIDINEKDVKAAVSIILQTVNVTISKETDEEEHFEQEEHSEQEEEHSDEEKLEFNLREDEKSSDESSGEDSGDEGHESDGSGDSDDLSPREDRSIMIEEFLNDLDEFNYTNKKMISKNIEEAIEFIKKNTTKINNKLKKNRINFFAKKR